MNNKLRKIANKCLFSTTDGKDYSGVKMLYLKKTRFIQRCNALLHKMKKEKCQSFFAVFMFCTTFDSYLLKV